MDGTLMANASPLILSFVFGAIFCAGIAFFLYRRHASALQSSNIAQSKRICELETQLTSQAEEFSNQLTVKPEHMTELDRLARERRQSDEDYSGEIKAKVREAETRAYEEGKLQAELRADEKGKAFSVIVRPFIRKIRDDGFLKKMNRIEIGYQYQLQINGIPCFAPHVVIEQHYEEKEVNQEVIERMTRLAIEAARVAVAIQAGPAGAFIPIADSPVIEG